MAGRRIIYLAALTFCGIFYIAYGQWLSWLILVTVVALPWFSLLLSLPAIVQFRGNPGGPDRLEMGDGDELWLMGSCAFPMPPFRGRLKLRHLITGETWYYQDRGDLRSGHCGAIAVTAEALRVCDYLGLFAIPTRSREKKTVLILPRPLKMDLEQEIEQYIAQRWKPKSGGGYGENHELRLYRPGDNLNQVHWKLSAKTGGLIIREPMEPQQGLVLLTMDLSGTAHEIDRKFGRLLWLGRYLTEKEIRFELRVLTAEGLLAFAVSEESELDRAVGSLLCQKATTKGTAQCRDTVASWYCHIGGAPDEA